MTLKPAIMAATAMLAATPTNAVRNHVQFSADAGKLGAAPTLMKQGQGANA
jgi:hypothetical protein